MTALPSGTATFLFSDIEGSTRLVQSRQHRVNQHRAYEGGACAGAVRSDPASSVLGEAGSAAAPEDSGHLR